MQNIMNIKKLGYSGLLTTLTIGASLILGLLSFGGLYVVLPVLSYPSIAFVLSVAYEGHIYFENIKNAFKKLFEPDFVEMELVRTYLLKKIQTKSLNNTQINQEDYKAYLHDIKLIHAFNGPDDELTREILEEKALSFENKFRETLLDQKDFTNDLKKRRWQFNFIRIFSGLSALFMSIGTSYLLLETFSIIPFLASLPIAIIPAIIAPMSLIAGIAYGLLTFNAITDMVNHNTFEKWFTKLSKDIKENGLNRKNIFIATSAVTLSLLAAALTFCTAGTWWTIVKNTPPLFRWMRQLPKFIMGVIHPIIISISSLSFILENTSSSLEMIEELASSKTSIKDVWNAFKKEIYDTYQRENIWQFINPARLLITLTIAPLRVLLFIGHLISVGLTTDRVPGLSYLSSALVGIVSEGFEDVHYFMKPEKDCSPEKLLEERLGGGCGHSHEDDFPTRLIMLIASPLYMLSSYWDEAFKTAEKPQSTTTKPQLTGALTPKPPTFSQKLPASHPGNTFFKSKYCMTVNELNHKQQTSVAPTV